MPALDPRIHDFPHPNKRCRIFTSLVGEVSFFRFCPRHGRTRPSFRAQRRLTIVPSQPPRAKRSSPRASKRERDAVPAGDGCNGFEQTGCLQKSTCAAVERGVEPGAADCAVGSCRAGPCSGGPARRTSVATPANNTTVTCEGGGTITQNGIDGYGTGTETGDTMERLNAANGGPNTTHYRDCRRNSRPREQSKFVVRAPQARQSKPPSSSALPSKRSPMSP